MLQQQQYSLLEQEFYDNLDNGRELNSLFKKLEQEEEETNLINKQIEAFYDELMNQKFIGSSKYLQECLVMYLRLLQSDTNEQYLLDIVGDEQILRKVVQTYTNENCQQLEDQLINTLSFINVLEQFNQILKKLNNMKKQYLLPHQSPKDRLEDYTLFRQTKEKLNNHPYSHYYKSTKLSESINQQEHNLLNSLSYHSQLYLKQNLIELRQVEDGEIEIKVSSDIYSWLHQNSIILEDQDLNKTLQLKVVKMCQDFLSHLQITQQPENNNSIIPYIVNFREDIENDIQGNYLVLQSKVYIPINSFYSILTQIFEGVICFLVVLDETLPILILADFVKIFRTILIRTLDEQVEINSKNNLITQIQHEVGQFRSQISDKITEYMDKFHQELDLQTLLVKHSQFSIIDNVRSNIVEFKNHVVHCNNLINEEFITYNKQNQLKPQSQGNKLKQFLISKTIGEKKKQTEPTMTTPELQKAQHLYFKTITMQFQKLDGLTRKSFEQQLPYEPISIIWDHYILMNFFLNDLLQNMEEKTFHFLNFYVSIMTQYDYQIEQFLSTIELYRQTIEVEDHQLGLFQQEVVEFMIKLKKSLRQLNLQLNKKKKLEIARDQQ